MLGHQVLPVSCPGEVVVGHPALDVEGLLDKVLPGLAPLDLLLADASLRLRALRGRC
jgi:hypothetical protein